MFYVVRVCCCLCACFFVFGCGSLVVCLMVCLCMCLCFRMVVRLCVVHGRYRVVLFACIVVLLSSWYVRGFVGLLVLWLFPPPPPGGWVGVWFV